MNKIYRTLWNEARGCHVVAHEKTASRGKPSTTRSAASQAVAVAVLALASPLSLAANVCPGSTSLTAPTDTCVIANGETVNGTVSVTVGSSISNAGTINFSGSAPAIAINGALSGSLNNSGSISAALGDGISINGSTVSGGITNSGNITANGGPISIYASNVSGGILNSGTLNGVSGIYVDQVVTGSGTISSTVSGGISNSGVISSSNREAVYVHSGVVSGDIANSGSIRSDNNDAIYLSGSTVSGNITNSGSISANSTGYDDGISVNESSIGGNIINSGNISVGRYGFRVSSSTISGGIANSGSISSVDRYGISVSGSTIAGGITNSGSIIAGGQGVSLGRSTISQGFTNSGLISGEGVDGGDRGASGSGAGVVISAVTLSGGIVNSGTILGSMVGIGVVERRDRTEISGSSTISGGLTNSGTISGGLAAIYDLGGALGSIAITGNSARLIGDVYAPRDDVTIKAGSSFANTNAFNVKSFAIEEGASFNLGESHSTFAFVGASTVREPSISINNGIKVSSGFTNAGTLLIAEGVTGTITGDYSQASAGSLQIGASSDTNYGKLVVSGTASLPDAARVKVDVNSVNTLVKDQVLSGVLSAGTLNASTFAVSDNSVLFNFRASQNGNSIDLTVTPGMTVEDAARATGNTVAIGGARVFDALISGTTSGSMGDVITKLGRLETAAQLSAAASQTLPLLTANTVRTNFNALSGINRVMQARTETASGFSSGEKFYSDKTFWAKPFGSWASQANGKNGSAGYDSQLGGIVFGTDGKVADNARIGVALAYGKADVDSKHGVAAHSADLSFFQLVGYGSYKLNPNTAIDYQLDIGKTNTRGRRDIDFMGLTANSKYDSLSAHAGVGISQLMALSSETSLMPSVRLDYTRIHDKGYTENGADALNLKVKANNSDALILAADGKVSHRLTDASSVQANLGVGYDLIGKRTSVVSSFAGASDMSFTTQGATPKRFILRGGVGLTSVTDIGVEINARYDVEHRQDFNNQTASVNLRWNF